MMTNFSASHTTPRLLMILLAVILIGGSKAKADGVTYQVNVNTVSINGTSGFLDFQFNPGGSGAQSATATINNFNLTSGALVGTPTLMGGASGLLPGAVNIRNNTPLNDYLHGITFGNAFSFMLTFSGAALNSPNNGLIGSDFSLLLFGQNFSLLPLTNADGELFRIALGGNGGLRVTNFGTSLVTINRVIPVPEPATITMLAAGLLGAGGWMRRRRRNF